MHKKLIDMVRYAKEKGIPEVIINTNGLLLDALKMEDLVNSKLDSILISIDGSDKETYEKIRKGGNYDILDNNIRELIRIRNKNGLQFPKVKLHAVRMKENCDSIDLLREIYSGIVDDIHISNETPFFDTDRNEKYEEEIRKAKRKSCSQLWQRLAISWNGDVAMCCNDWIPQIVLGNIDEKSIYDIWHGEKLNYIRDLHRQMKFEKISVCKDCICPESYEQK
jgi:radical SAM protein with 4Fe4S-binding SPASM domain